jgi:hypothetical protein
MDAMIFLLYFPKNSFPFPQSSTDPFHFPLVDFGVFGLLF